MRHHLQFMKEAFCLAEKAAKIDEVPVGAVVVHQGIVIGSGYNQIESLKDPMAHAEILAITSACKQLHQKHLPDCTLYVTLEPCAMCAGAIVLSRMERVVFSATDSRAGGCGSIFNIVQNQHLNHRVEIVQGIMEAECEELLVNYFKFKRMN